MKGSGKLPLDKVDIASGPIFIATMLWEAKILRERNQREFGDLDSWTGEQLSDPTDPPDPLVPVGYDTTDTRASLLMLLGNVTVNALLALLF